MKHVLIEVLTDDLPQASLTLAQLRVLHPDSRSADEELFPIIPGETFREIYDEAKTRFEKVLPHVELDPFTGIGQIRVVAETELKLLNRWLGETWSQFSSYEEDLRQLAERERMVDELEQALENFANLNVDLGRLQGEKRFLDLQIGVVPRANLQQLEEAAGLAEHVTFTFLMGEGHAHVVIVGPKGERETEIKAILNTAGFRPLTIPPELQDSPAKVRQDLLLQRQEILSERNRRRREMEDWAAGIKEELEHARKTLILAEPFVRIESAVRSSGYLSVITGWIPARELTRTRNAFAQSLPHPFLINSRDPSPDERPLVPTIMRRSALLTPFSNLVKQYGVPRYGEVDPTLFFALTFVVMFGMMFGDIGHGGTIVAVAWVARRKLRSFTPFVMAAGSAAVVFGFAYGSVFGFEELQHPLWIAPLSDPMLMLGVALGWGAAFLVAVTAVSIYNRLIDRNLGAALFESNGVASISLYIAMLCALYDLYTKGECGRVSLTVATVSLLSLLAYRWHESSAPAAERFLMVLIATFETVTGYLSNTLSFLRVTAFSLNHVALAIAVLTLAETMSAPGQWITVILGNLFIIVLEGAIVTIQALRLEYFEGFSRFFAGDGLEFQPLALKTGAL